MGEQLRKLKDEGAALIQKGKFDKALSVFQQILAEDPKDLTAQLKCGELYHRLGHPPESIRCYTAVARTYAEDGLLLKAIAACKLILDIDRNHTQTQRMLAALYAKKGSRGVPGSLAAEIAGVGPVAETPAGEQPNDAAVAQPPLVGSVWPALHYPTAAARAESGTDETAAQPLIHLTQQAAPQQQPVNAPVPAIPLFSDLPKNAFIQLLEQMRMHHVVPGEVILREGDVGASMFIISCGRVKVSKTSDKGTELILAHLGDGAFFGEMALLSAAPRMASVVAELETTLFEVSREVLDAVVEKFPSVKNTMVRFYRQRLLSNLMTISPLFTALDETQRKSLVEKFKSREVEANERLLEEGEQGDGLYVLLSGAAEVSTHMGGKTEVLAHLKEGDVFGEMSLLHHQAAMATVRTLRQSFILKLSRRNFAEVISTHPQLLAYISDLSSEREKINDAILKGQLTFRDGGLVVV